MTVSTSKRVKRHVGNGVTTKFPYDFYIPNEESLEVYLYDSNTGVNQLLNPSVYSVTGIGDDNFGEVTYPLSGPPITSTQTLTIRRVVEYDQNTSIRNQTGFFPEVIEDALDHLTFQTQQNAENLSRATVAPLEEETDMTLPSKAKRASKVAGWDSAGEWTALSQLDKSADTVTATGSSMPRSLAERFAEVSSVKDDGAIGDGVTNDSAAVKLAEARVSSGGELVMPWTAAAYVIGDGTTLGTGLEPLSNTRIRGVGGKPKLIHRAKNAAGQNRLIHIANADRVTVENLEADGEGAVRNHITMEGVVRDAAFRDLHLHGGKNFGLQFADTERDPALARFEGITVVDVVVDGDTGLAGAGSGMIFFPRAQETGLRPASKDLRIDRYATDITNGSTNVNNHGPQGVKIQNTDGVYLGHLRTTGGSVAGYSITTGVRNLFADVLETRRANAGVILSASARYATTRLQDIHLGTVSYLEDGVTGGTGSRRDTLQIEGAVPRTTVEEVVGDGNVYIIALNEQRWSLTNVVGEFATRGTGTDIDIVGGTSGFTARVEGWSAEDPTVIQWSRQSGTPLAGETITDQSTGATAELVSETDMNLVEGLMIGRVQLRNGGFYTNANGIAGLTPISGCFFGMMVLNGGSAPRGFVNIDSNWPIQDSVFEGVIGRRHAGNRLVETWGIRNRWGPIISVNGNPNGVSTSMVVVMQGDHEVFEEISIQTHSGTHDIDNWFRCTAGNGGHRILLLRGTPSGGATHRGMDILNQENNDPLLGDLVYHAGPFDLSGAAEEVLIPMDRNARVLSIVLTFPEATSADTGVALEVGVVGANTRFLNETTPTGQSDMLVYQNTAGTRSFSSRHIVAGETLRIAHAGGKSGDGVVGVTVNMVTVLQ